jgi:hypothetical protein
MQAIRGQASSGVPTTGAVYGTEGQRFESSRARLGEQRRETPGYRGGTDVLGSPGGGVSPAWAARSRRRHGPRDAANQRRQRELPAFLLLRPNEPVASDHVRLRVKAVTVASDAAHNRKTTRVNVTIRAPKRSR